jgi:type III restriction enzyme
MKLKIYQENSVLELVEKSRKQLSKHGNKKILFQAPTGSGKTIMMAEYLAKLCKSFMGENQGLSVIWTAPRSLHTQSKEKLRNYYSDTNDLKCREFYELTNLYIDSSEILFLNWESINKQDKNLIVVRNERNFYLNKIVENSKLRGNKVILIIDESHYSSTSSISQKLISDISPDLTIEVSATPATVNGIDDLVKIDREEVIAAGMIKKSLVLNQGYDNFYGSGTIASELTSAQDEQLLDISVKKQNQLREMYEKIDSKVRPLIIIQLPDNKANNEDLLISKIQSYLSKKHAINTDNGRLAIYLSNEKVNLENLTRNDSKVDILLFKQAIALGWDCPRAQILVLFRESKSLSFSIQTMGRIMRMPEPELGHYPEEEINSSYVFTNISEITVNEDIGRDYISIYTSKRSSVYKNINLRSVHAKRQREKTRLNPDFTNCFLKSATEFKLISKIDLEALAVNVNYITDTWAQSVDELREAHIRGELKREITNDSDIQELFNAWIANSLSLYFPEVRTLGRIKESLYKFFELNTSIDFEVDQLRINRVVLNSSNSEFFKTVINIAEERYRDLVGSKAAELEEEVWNVPEYLSISGELEKLDVKKSILSPFYINKQSKPELAFIHYLDNNSAVEWWFRNGDRDATYFAIEYSDSEGQKPFYIDFVILSKKGVIWLIDTKRGYTIELGKSKSDALLKYISEGKNLDGGFVDNTEKEFNGIWKVFKGKSDALNSLNLSNWNLLEF